MKKKKIAIVGTNGIPAQYGGYETLVENITYNLNSDFDFVVYCSKKNQKSKLNHFNNSKLKYINLNANGWQSLPYDIFTLFHAAFTADVILYLGPGAGFICPLIALINNNIIINHGGLNEWERLKYNKKVSNVISLAEAGVTNRLEVIEMTENNQRVRFFRFIAGSFARNL